MSGLELAPLVPCPTCARRTAYTPANRWRPFCSERCRSIDLGAWASERFRVPASSSPADADESGEHPRPPGG
jgi:endogenous inhibitor of DNA gyrase (YacG/DUF329 family)